MYSNSLVLANKVKLTTVNSYYNYIVNVSVASLITSNKKCETVDICLEIKNDFAWDILCWLKPETLSSYEIKFENRVCLVGIVWLFLFRFLEDLDEGVHIQQTLESVLQNEDGKQLLVRWYV